MFFFFYLWQMLRSSFRHAEEQWVFCHPVYVNVYSFFGYPLKHVLYNKTECRIPFILRHWEMVPLIPMSLTPFSWYIPQPFLHFGRVTYRNCLDLRHRFVHKIVRLKHFVLRKNKMKNVWRNVSEKKICMGSSNWTLNNMWTNPYTGNQLLVNQFERQTYNEQNGSLSVTSARSQFKTLKKKLDLIF